MPAVRPGSAFGRAARRPPPPHPLSEGVRQGSAPDVDGGTRPSRSAPGMVPFLLLCVTAWLLAPAWRPLVGEVPPRLAGTEAEAAREQAIAPPAFGSRTGRRSAPNDLAIAVGEAAERPVVDLAVTLGEGDTLAHALARSGVGSGDGATAVGLVARVVPLEQLAPGTRVMLKLGPRSAVSIPRPLQSLAMRARLDLAISVTRQAGHLALMRTVIPVDATPLRLRGRVGPSLYRSARAAGARPTDVVALIRALASRFSFAGDISASDVFDLVIDRRRAATGEMRLGGLLMAGLDQGGRRTDLIRWNVDGHEGWFDADGRFERRGAIGMPVAGRITSPFGMRFHPLLGFNRMHKGIDIGAPVGTPVIAVVPGIVLSAGWSGGYGNFIRLAHGGSLATGYGHLSRMLVAPGQQVGRGQVIGYVGSTGLSTGPHLHWEVWRAGVAVDPLTMSVDNIASLTAAQMAAFRSRAAYLLDLGTERSGVIAHAPPMFGDHEGASAR